MSSFAPTATDGSSGDGANYREFDDPNAEFFKGKVYSLYIYSVD